MTDNEIIKALECHIKRQCWNDCPNATEERQLLNKPCSQMIAEDTLSLINRQKAEIDGWQQLANLAIDTQNEMNDIIIEQKAEIERLEKLSEKLLTDFNGLSGVIKRANAVAIKEFAKTVKSRSHAVLRAHCNIDAIGEFEDCVNNLVKEMVGDGNGRR